MAFMGITWYLLAIALLGLVLVVGGDVMGAQRWIHVGPLSMQPSEFAKLALINFLAAYLASRRADIERFINGFALPLGLILLAVALIMLEPDLGTSVAIIGIAVMMLYAAGTRIASSDVGGCCGTSSLRFNTVGTVPHAAFYSIYKPME